jgi:hypothetical protein
MPQHFEDLLRFQDKAIGVLQKCGFDHVNIFPLLSCHGIDVCFDFRNAAPREFGALICGTEQTLIPGTDSGSPDKEAPGFTRRPYYTLLYTLLIHEIISIFVTGGQKVSRRSKGCQTNLSYLS